MQQMLALLAAVTMVCVSCATGEGATRVDRAAADTAADAAQLAPFSVTLPGSGVSIEMLPIPGGAVDGESVAPFWMSATEITWDAFDLFLYGHGRDGIDAVSRPSVPYISMDRGFGHEGWPVISLSPKGARAFCEWLTELTGRTFRLPTVSEWRHAAGPPPADLGASAWYAANAGGKTQRPRQKAPNVHGLYDMLGNAGEWCLGPRGPVLAGGTYRDAAALVGPAASVRPSPAWNASDPQIPRSTWWLADAGFAGLRVVCEAP